MTNPLPPLSTLSSLSLIVSSLFFFFSGNAKPDCHFRRPSVHKDDISREQLKELLYDEIMSFRPAPIT